MTDYRLTSRLLDVDAVQELLALKTDLSYDVFTSYTQDLPESEDPVALSMGSVVTAGLIILMTDTAVTVSVCDAAAPFTVEGLMVLAGVDVATELDVVAVGGAHIQVFIAGNNPEPPAP